MEKQKRIKRERIYQGNIISLYQDTLELPDKRMVTYDFIHHNGAAAVIPVTKEGKILMVNQYRNAIDRVTLEIPAGKMDENEDGITCASRELEEETGYRAGHLEWLITIDSWVAFTNEKIDVFVATQLEPTAQHLDEDEFIDVKEMELSELIDMILNGTIRDAKTIAAIMSYQVKVKHNCT